MNDKLQDNLNIAYTQAKRVNKALQEEYGVDEFSFVPLEFILNAVKECSDYTKITVFKQSFSKVLPKRRDGLGVPGAMLSTTDSADGKTATIILNADMNADMQRFSMVHELGHLITAIPNFKYEEPNDNKSTLSAHINPDITWIEKEEYENSDYLVAEQVANVFALLILIPRNIKIKDLIKEGIEGLARRYGVTEDAIYSRIILSTLSFN